MKLLILLLAPIAVISLASCSILPAGKIHFISLPRSDRANSSVISSPPNSQNSSQNSSQPPPFPSNVFAAQAYFLPNSTICPMGTLKATTEDGFDCVQQYCRLDSDCTVLFGINTTCSPYTHNCICDSNHSVDHEQKCTIFSGPSTTQSPQSIILNSTCYDNGQCSGALYGSECRDGQCACAFGFIPDPSTNGTSCKEAYCYSSNAYCQSLFNDPNVICDSWEQVCTCPRHFRYDHDLRSCQPTINQLGAECFTNDDCDLQTAACVDNTCACQFGYAQNRSISAYSCQLIACADDWDCKAQASNGSYCWAGSCSCDYDGGFLLDSSSQKCTLKAHLLDTACFDDDDCGSSASCVYDKCRCNSGFQPKKNNLDCSPVNCQEDTDCQVFDPNSKCSDTFNSCTCKDGFSIDGSLQMCTKDTSSNTFIDNDDNDDDDDDDYDYSLATSVSILAIFSILFILLGIAIVARNRREFARQQLMLQRQRQRAAAAQRQATQTAYVTSTAKVTLPVTQKS